MKTALLLLALVMTAKAQTVRPALPPQNPIAVSQKTAAVKSAAPPFNPVGDIWVMSGNLTAPGKLSVVMPEPPCDGYYKAQLQDGSCQTITKLHFGPDKAKCVFRFDPQTDDPEIVCTWTNK